MRSSPMSAKPLLRSEGSDRLRARRARARSRLGIVLGVLAIVALGLFLWLLWQPYTRISAITIYGAGQEYRHYAEDAMRGSYLLLVPRDSAFFYPERTIRATILSAHPEVATVSIFREGLAALSIKITERVAVARWCGPVYVPLASSCYLFDASGIVYATTSAATSTDETLNGFIVFGPLVASTVDPIRSTLSRAAQLPAAFNFARQVGALGASTAAVAIRDDEVDEYLASGTRLTYVLGDEQTAYTALVSARADYNLANGSIEYLDLRFPGKIYLKRVSRQQ